MKLTKEDVIDKFIPIENEEHFNYVTGVLKGLGFTQFSRNFQYTEDISHLHADTDFEIVRCCWLSSRITDFRIPRLSQTLPEKFKLSCGDKPEVRQWLKDQGFTWYTGGDLTRVLLTNKYSYFNTVLAGFVPLSEEEYKANPTVSKFIEINPIISEREVTITEKFVSGFEVVNQKSEKEIKLEELVGKLQEQLEEAQKQLSEI